MNLMTNRIKYAVGRSFIVVAMIVAFAVTNVSAQIYPSGMVGYWKLDGSLIDELGIYNGVMGPYGSYVDGIINQGLYGAMGCSNPYAAKVDNFPNLNSFTVETWIKPAGPPYSMHHSLTVTKWKEIGTNGKGFFLFTEPFPYGSSNFRFFFHLGDGTNLQGFVSPLTYASGNWYHVVATRDYGEVLKLYVNGEEVASALDNIIGSIANTEPLFFHGFTSGGCGYIMSAITMDEVAVYDRVLSEAEIQQHYQNVLNGLGYEVVVIPVPIDIKPGSFPNSINLKSNGNVPVAVLSSPTFDATTVDRNTVVFAGAPPLPIGKSSEDVNGDGVPDVVLHFKTQDLNLQPSDTEACLSGKTLDGQDIEGCDSVRIIK